MTHRQEVFVVAQTRLNDQQMAFFETFGFLQFPGLFADCIDEFEAVRESLPPSSTQLRAQPVHSTRACLARARIPGRRRS